MGYCTIAEVKDYLGRPAANFVGGRDTIGNQTSTARFSDDTIQTIIDAGADEILGTFQYLCTINATKSSVKMMNILFACATICRAELDKTMDIASKEGRSGALWSEYITLQKMCLNNPGILGEDKGIIYSL
jgi:hypothetical protein